MEIDAGRASQGQQRMGSVKEYGAGADVKRLVLYPGLRQTHTESLFYKIAAPTGVLNYEEQFPSTPWAPVAEFLFTYQLFIVFVPPLLTRYLPTITSE